MIVSYCSSVTPKRYFCGLVANSRPIVAFAIVLTYPSIKRLTGSFSLERPNGLLLVAYYTFEGYDFIQLGIGDFCCTRLHGDTTYMSPCNIRLNTDNFIGGTIYDESSLDIERAYVYIYHLDYITMKVGKPYIYETTPKWSPCYKDEFWGIDGWFYIEGYDHETKQHVYHKVRPKDLSK